MYDQNQQIDLAPAFKEGGRGFVCVLSHGVFFFFPFGKYYQITSQINFSFQRNDIFVEKWLFTLPIAPLGAISVLDSAPIGARRPLEIERSTRMMLLTEHLLI